MEASSVVAKNTEALDSDLSELLIGLRSNG
jgi:hypothetical protein